MREEEQKDSEEEPGGLTLNRQPSARYSKNLLWRSGRSSGALI